MSDREIIIKSLEKAERRLRANRLFGDLTLSLSLFLLFPLTFKIWDLFSPFRGRTVAAVLGIWVACLGLYSLWRILQKGTLEQTAAQVDTKAALYDELKTAYWFITHPLTSDWVDVQIRRASKRASELNMDRLYPRVVPANSYLAAGLLALLIGLNFVPLPWNHNWVYLQAARDEVLDTAAIEKALNKIAEDFETSEQLKEAAQALREMDLENAAKKMKKLSDELEAATAEQLKKTQEALKKASEDPQDGLTELSEDLKSSAESLKDQDMKAAKKALEEAAEFLKDLSEKIQSQPFKDQAGKELQGLAQSLQERNANSHQTAVEPQSGDGEPGNDDAGQAPTESEDTPADNAQNGSPQQPSGNPSRRPSSSAPVEGPPTQNLNVQLQQEKLTGQYDQEVKPEEIEQASKQERSKLDYRNVPSELSAAQKDVLNQERIPWEYRRLIKNYFAAIQRPREGTRAAASASPRGAQAR